MITLFLLGLFFVSYFHMKKLDKKVEWFNNLKTGDEIKVRIYSKYCECLKDATVVKHDGKYIEAEIKEINKCEECSQLNATDENSNTCWYKVTFFKIDDVEIK